MSGPYPRPTCALVCDPFPVRLKIIRSSNITLLHDHPERKKSLHRRVLDYFVDT